jgi:hypothetical protein
VAAAEPNPLITGAAAEWRVVSLVTALAGATDYFCRNAWLNDITSGLMK